RRLQGKTQLYPSVESDFFRNRLTHSLEVAQIAKSIAIRINHRFKNSKGDQIIIDENICEFAGLAHDLGHPPFGHQGEEALDESMMDYGGFEGNAQTLRILTKLEKKIIHSENIFYDDSGRDTRMGLNLTYRSLASILKYDNQIPACRNLRKPEDREHAVKGFYSEENDVVKEIKKNIVGKSTISNFKTVECQIMDIADDIAYSTYDLEDGLKAGFYTPFKILFSDSTLIKRVRKKVNRTLNLDLSDNDIIDVLFDIFSDIFSDIKLEIPKNVSKEEFRGLAIKVSQLAFGGSNFLASNGAVRTSLTSYLVGEFVRGVEFEYDSKYPPLSKVWLKNDVRLKVEV
ncbi:MAG: dGTP triphosphohydrolase, partial [Crocinitomicaceae bacterium]